MDRETIIAALSQPSEALGEQGLQGEVCLFGGTAMVVAFAARPATKDVDAVFRPAQVIRSIAGDLARSNNLPEDWLNDAVKGFVSSRHETTTGDLPQFPHLRLTMPVPEYLLAMKCMAARIGGVMGEGSDEADIRFLIRHLGLASATQVLELVTHYYPRDTVPPRTHDLVESIFEEWPE